MILKAFQSVHNFCIYLIDFGSLYSPLDASCGMMADLYPLMQADSDLRGILQEEAAYLFNEGRYADDVANIIQNRASFYISEKK